MTTFKLAKIGLMSAAIGATVAACSSNETQDMASVDTEYKLVSAKTDSDIAQVTADKAAVYSVATPSVDSAQKKAVATDESSSMAMIDPLEITVHFDFDSSQLDQEAKEALDDVIDDVEETDVESVQIALIGHADSIGESSYNESLSEKRAQAVEAYLDENTLPSEVDWTIAGLGEKAPISSNETEAGREENRRVEIMVRFSPDMSDAQAKISE